MLTVQVDPEPDYDRIAPMANEAFGPGATFTPRRLRWLYEQAFGHGALTLSLRHEGERVGHIAVVRQAVQVGGRTETAGQLVDLFILKAFRSREAIALLYGEVARQVEAQGIRFIFAIPNGNATGVNKRFLSLEPFLPLPVRAGVCLPFRSARVTSTRFEAARPDEMRPRLARYGTGPDAGPTWDGDRLFGRLSDDTWAYGLHATPDHLLVSSPRVLRKRSCTLLCGFLSRPGTRLDRGEQGALVRAACAFWTRPVFVYVGRNAALPSQPGFALPARLRGSPMILQTRDFAPAGPPLVLDRFELLDFDFA